MATDVEGVASAAPSAGLTVTRHPVKQFFEPPLATFYYQATPATTYWRCELPARYLPGTVHSAPRLSADKDESTGLWSFPDVENDTAVMQFPGDQGSAMISMLMRAQGKKFFVEVDDNYLDRGDDLWRTRSGWGHHIGSTPHTTDGHNWIVANASGVICTTRALAEEYGEKNPNVWVCRNSVDPNDWPELRKPDDGVFRIGWYASGSHDRDGEVVRKAMSWASRQPGVEIVNIGLDPVGWNFRRRWHGWRDDFLEHRALLMELDVGISPLVGTPMTRFRSDLKLLEYAMGGAMPFVQRAEPYHEWLDQEFVRGCSTPSDWMSAIKWAVQNQDEVRVRARQAREFVLRERTVAAEIHQWRNAIDSDREDDQ